MSAQLNPDWPRAGHAGSDQMVSGAPGVRREDPVSLAGSVVNDACAAAFRWVLWAFDGGGGTMSHVDYKK